MMKQKPQKISPLEQFQNLIEKLLKQRQNQYSKTPLHDGSHSWLGTGTSIKSGELKLVL